MRRELTYSQPQPRRARRKPGVTAKARAKRNIAEWPVIRRVRAKCVKRDGYCRVETAGYGDLFADEPIDGDVLPDFREAHRCYGDSQWAHMHSRRRAQTRNQAPEIRHDTAHSFMACQRHHDQYDGRQKPRLFVTALSSKGADGPLKFRLGE